MTYELSKEQQYCPTAAFLFVSIVQFSQLYNLLDFYYRIATRENTSSTIVSIMVDVLCLSSVT